MTRTAGGVGGGRPQGPSLSRLDEEDRLILETKPDVIRRRSNTAKHGDPKTRRITVQKDKGANTSQTDVRRVELSLATT
jgi:hypothetical protein